MLGRDCLFFPPYYNGLFLQCVDPQDIKGQCWTDEESDGENEPEQFLYGIQVKQTLLNSAEYGSVKILIFCFQYWY